tara:strand:- start:1076 stop:1276 length:201 start_codon:yes stop_codon:yes gene_type:complete
MKKSNQSKGLGDSVEKFTKATGIKSLAELAMGAVGKKDCGCKKRKEWLNNVFPYNYKKDYIKSKTK